MPLGVGRWTSPERLREVELVWKLLMRADLSFTGYTGRNSGVCNGNWAHSSGWGCLASAPACHSSSSASQGIHKSMCHKLVRS